MPAASVIPHASRYASRRQQREGGVNVDITDLKLLNLLSHISLRLRVHEPELFVCFLGGNQCLGLDTNTRNHTIIDNTCSLISSSR